LTSISLPPNLLTRLGAALQARRDLLDPDHLSGLRLFNGFYEGWPELVVDLYARTLYVQDYAASPAISQTWLPAVQSFYLAEMPWLHSVVVKQRRALSPPTPSTRQRPAPPRSLITYGENPDRRLLENGVWYALDLLSYHDASLYLDTRLLRAWAKERLAGKKVLNAFAYTGSLGLAALAGGASRVLHVDRNRRALALARDSYELNGFPIQRPDFMVMDFFPAVARLKRSQALFDCAFLDPPFFSVTASGVVDQLNQGQRLINKVRPLVAHGGWLVAVNNALYLSGREYLNMLKKLAADGYLEIEELLPVPTDITGYTHTAQTPPPADPDPFNHPTKIAVLRIKRKDAALHQY
jgi:23S rRNA (cytosine1962-C5)-methyltransferase